MAIPVDGGPFPRREADGRERRKTDMSYAHTQYARFSGPWHAQKFPKGTFVGTFDPSDLARSGQTFEQRPVVSILVDIPPRRTDTRVTLQGIDNCGPLDHHNARVALNKGHHAVQEAVNTVL